MLINHFVNTCRQYPNKTTLIDANTRESLTYGQLFSAVQKLSAHISAATHSPHIGLLLPNSKEFVITALAILYSGKTIVPIHYFLSQPEIAAIIKDAGIEILITPDYLKTVDWNITALPEPKEISNHLAAILYTSGTCGEPKGVMLTEQNLLSNIIAMRDAIKLENYTVLSILPFSHGFGFTCGLLSPMLLGYTMVALARFNPMQVLETIDKYNGTVFLTVPSIYRALLRVPGDNQSIRKILLPISGGEALPRDVAEEFIKKFNLNILEGYGLTETSPVVTINTREDFKSGTVGKPLKDVTVKTATDGEIWVKGPNVMAGYYQKPLLTNQIITADGWFQTGDLGRLDADGFLSITGRKKELIISGGENILPSEIENILIGHPFITECAVIGVPDKARGEVPKAFVVSKPGITVTTEEIKEFCRGRLANIKIPSHIEFRAELPHGPTGKILKKLLKQPPSC